MLETQADVESLAQLLDTSYAAAGAHLKAIQTAPLRLTAADVLAHFSGATICDVATVDAAGQPFVAPVDVLFIKGKAWFSSAEGSLRFINIRRNPRVSLARTVGSEISILIHGIAHVFDVRVEDSRFLHELCVECYGPDYDNWGLWGYPWAWIEPRRMFASRLPSE